LRKLVVLTVIALAASGGSYGTKTAQAHLMPCLHHVEKKPATYKLKCANKTIHHAKTGISWLKHNQSHLFITSSLTWDQWLAELQAHKWLLSYGLKLQTEANAVLYPHPPHESAWLCIHRYEGSWKDSGDPYWGGLQMDRGFMATYAPYYYYKFHVNLLAKGYADRWTPMEQMWVAELALMHGKTFHGGWPNTSRMCGY
jgi:hypothetical protein